MAKEFLVKAEKALNNTPDINLKNSLPVQNGNLKNKLLSIT